VWEESREYEENVYPSIILALGRVNLRHGKAVCKLSSFAASCAEGQGL
jgi:hypothetical protein